MAHLPKPYDRDRVLDRLRRHGVYAVMVRAADTPEAPSVLSHLEAHEDEPIGLKLWAYIDSLGVSLYRTKVRGRKAA